MNASDTRKGGTGRVAEAEGGKRTPLYRVLFFFLPLAVLAVSQSLTYPLVGSIVSRGRLGEQEFTAYAMGQQVLFFLGSVGFGLITTAMMFCRNRRGYRNFLRMNQGIALTAALLQGLACLPPFNRWVFGGILGLEGEMAVIARNSLALCIPLQYIFFLRNPYLGTLFVEKQSWMTNIATGIRIALAVVFARQFPVWHLTGYFWGVVANTIPVILETVVTYLFARPFLRRLPAEPAPGEPVATPGRQLRYTLPLSCGGTLLSLSPILVSTFLSRSPDPFTFRPIHFFVIGICNPISYSALKMQTVTVAFPPKTQGLRRIFAFGLVVGLILAALPLLASFSQTLTHAYFCVYQKLPESSLGMARTALAVTAVLPIVFALRGHAEGLAAVSFRTDIVMFGQILYFCALAGMLALCRWVVPVPGYLWGICAIGAGATAAGMGIYLSLFLHSRRTRLDHLLHS